VAATPKMPAPCDAAMDDVLSRRSAGILLHVTSLPSGRLDDDAMRWLDFMASAGLGVWQVLPLVLPDSNGSPYQSASAFASDPRLLPRDRHRINESDFAGYCGREAYWLDDFALFQVLKRRFEGKPWFAWPHAYRHRDDSTLKRVAGDDAVAIDAIKREQYRLDLAWGRIRRHAHERDIALFGDIPIFVAHDSADTWSRPENFLLDEEGHPIYVTGVPPDYFSETGQRWGNPHYRWDRMESDGFAWWLSRMQRQFDLFDIVRIDHFRGLVAVWMIEAGCDTAIDGYWQETPGEALLNTLKQDYPQLPIVAEDLGVITEEVRSLRRSFELPGMSVLQFAFDQFEDNPHKPVNITPDDVVYTGTHDNDTCVGWFGTLEAHEKAFVFDVLESEPRDDIAWLMIETAMQTEANLAIAPLQDFLGLGSSARMNTPGVAEGNWRWRFSWDMLPDDLPQRIHSNIQASGRLYAR
jgi:4-alpha-glucanotransferase